MRLAEDSGGEVHYVDRPERGDRSVLVTPLEFVDGETPLIVSLHGYGGNSADHTTYVPLHERVNTDGFALLLPNGTLDGGGNQFWNPTDRCCDGGKSGEDDVAYLTELVASAKKVKDFGPVYFFGYSNGGFMAHHMACKGLPGLRAVASLAGTSYVEDTSCDGAPPVSVLHIHGTEDAVILFEGDESDPDPKGEGERAFYAGAQDMVMRWSQRAGCDWPEHPQPYATLAWTNTCRAPKPGHSAWNRAAPTESMSSFGWARAAAIHPATATPSRTHWSTGFCHKISCSAFLGSSRLSTSMPSAGRSASGAASSAV